MQTPHIDTGTFTHFFPRRASTPAASRVAPAPRARREAQRDRRNVDDELLTLIALGDIGAAETFKARHEVRLVEIAFDVLGDESEAARIAEVALEDACRGWPPERGRVAWWLRSIVRRRARARSRSLFTSITS